MKGIILFLFFNITIAACKGPDKKTTNVSTPENKQTSTSNKALEDSANFTTMYWLDSTYQDLGKVEEGRVVDVAFRFKKHWRQAFDYTHCVRQLWMYHYS